MYTQYHYSTVTKTKINKIINKYVWMQKGVASESEFKNNSDFKIICLLDENKIYTETT